MKNIGDTLKKLREENGMTRKDAADKLKSLGIDISDKTLYGYESGRNSANADMFLALCKIYKCNNIMETFSGTVEDILFTNSEWNMVEKYRSLDDSGRAHVDTVLDWEAKRVSKLTELQNHAKNQASRIVSLERATRPIYYISYYQRMASAGNGEYLFDDLPTDIIEVVDSPIARQADFVLGVNGKSMEPTYCDGDKVFVEKTDEIPNGSIGVFTRGNECYIKELGADRLISHNPDKETFPDILVDDREVKLVGKVLGKVEVQI